MVVLVELDATGFFPLFFKRIKLVLVFKKPELSQRVLNPLYHRLINRVKCSVVHTVELTAWCVLIDYVRKTFV